MKIKLKILLLNLLIVALILAFSANVMATDKINPIIPDDAKPVEKIINTLVSVFQVAAIGIGTVLLTTLGIKYMISSPDDKAEVKKHAVVFIVGALLAFGSSGIVQIFKMFFTGIG